MDMYGNEYKNSKSGKEVKEKEDKADIYKDTSQEVKRFVPSLEKINNDKKRTFSPSLTPEPKQKRTNFTPSMELPKEPKQKRFTPTLDIETTKKRRNFTPSLEMPEKKERTFIPDFSLENGGKSHRKRVQSYKEMLNKEFIENLIKSVNFEEMPPKREIKQKILVANPEKFKKLKEIAIEQIKHYSETGKKKYSNKEIMREIQYRDRDRLKNSLTRLVGDHDLYKLFFTKKGSEPKYSLKDISKYVKEIGQDKYKIPGIITERGTKMFQQQIKKGINPVAAYTEIWCQHKGHKPFKIRVSHLIYDKTYCSRCSSDAQANTIKDTIRIGYKNGFILKESENSYVKKMKARKNKRPVDVKLEWECMECGTSHKRSTQSLENPKAGCKICAARALEITMEQVTQLGKNKGLKLDMTYEEFEIAKEKMRKQNKRVTLAELKWLEAGKRVIYPYAYVQRAKPSSFKYKNIYKSPTRHPSSAEENEGRQLMQDIFGVKFDHTYLCNIIGNQVEVKTGVIKKVHPRSHVDGYNIVQIKSRKYEVVYEFWEMYWHSKYKTRHRDAFKRDAFDAKGDIILIKLNDQIDKKFWAKEIAKQFNEQTGISIQDMIPQKTLQRWLVNDLK